MLYGVLPWFLRGFLKLRLRQPIIFSEKTTKLTQDTYVHDKLCLECPKNINN